MSKESILESLSGCTHVLICYGKDEVTVGFTPWTPNKTDEIQVFVRRGEKKGYWADAEFVGRDKNGNFVFWVLNEFQYLGFTGENIRHKNPNWFVKTIEKFKQEYLDKQP